MEKLEIKGVKTAEDIKNVYLQAVEENVKEYRAVSNSGKFYGWETSLAYPQGHHILAQAGQEWFVNDKYVEPVEEPEVEPMVEETAEEPTEEPVVEEVEQPVEETTEEPAEIDYKALYETTLEKLNAVEEELAQKDEEIFGLKGTIEKISTEYANYKAEIETVKKFFKE